MITLLLRLFLLWLLSLPSWATPLLAPPYLPPQVLDVRSGLSQNTVEAIYRDHNGFLWFATQDGLNRYDGTQIKRFYAEADSSANPYGLASNHLTALTGDNENQLWLGTANGDLQRFDGKLFRSYQTPWQHQYISHLASVGHQLAVANDLGLWLLDLGSQQWQKVLDGKVKDLAASGNALWVLTADGRLFELEDSQLTLKLTRPDLQALTLDPKGMLWLAGDGQLWHYTDSGLIQVLQWASFAEHPALKLMADGKGHFYLALKRRGLMWLDPYHQKAEQLLQGTQHNLVDWPRTLYVDADNQLWVGTFSRGVIHLPGHDGAIRYFSHGEPQANQNNVRSLLKDAQGLWIGTMGNGLWRIDNQGQYHNYNAELARLTGQSPTRFLLVVTALAKDSQGDLWIGTNQGLIRYDNQQQWQWFSTEQGLSDPLIWSLLWHNGQLLVGTEKGLDAFNGETFSHRDSQAQFYALAEHQGVVMAATGKGFCRLEPRARCWGKPQITGRGRGLLSDGNNGWWVGTQKGLVHLGAQDQLTLYQKQPGLEDDTIYAVAQDSENQLWLSTNRGLVLFNPSQGRFSAPPIDQFILEYNGNAVFKDGNGLLYFGGVNGLAEIQFGANNNLGAHYALQWVGASVNGQPHNLNSDEVLVLPPDISRLSLSFADLDFGHGNNQYLYQLDGPWQPLGMGKEVVFTHLTPGHYQLKLRRLGDPQPPLLLNLEVLEPWYLQPVNLLWEILLLALLVAWLWYRWWLRRERGIALRRALADSEQRLRLAMVASGYGVWDWDWQTQAVVRTGLDFLGYQDGEIAPNRRGLSQLVNPEDQPKIIAAIKRHLKGQDDHYHCIYRLRHAKGHWLWVQDRGRVVARDDNGKVLRMAGTHRDISAERAQERQLQLSDLVTRAMSEGVVVTNERLDIINTNPAVETHLATPTETLLALKPWRFLPKTTRLGLLRKIRGALKDQGSWAGELRIQDGHGQLKLLETEIHWAQDQAQGANLVVLFSDITQRKAAEEELRYLANFDPLTGLPNRTLFRDRLGHAMTRANRTAQQVALLFLDLDHFKHVNDSLGHELGDRLLKEVAQRLLHAVRSYDTVARLGGDEFIIIMEDVKETLTTTLVAEKVMQALEPPVVLAGHRVSVTPSIGIALYPQDSTDPNTLLRYADTAMYHAKARGRGNFQYYTNTMNAAAQRRLALEHGLRQALEEGGLSLRYQPRIRLGNNLVAGVEALCRWHHPELGEIPPSDFIPLAEETGLISALGQWVLREALTQQKVWRQQGIILQMAVNLSARQFQDHDLPGQVTQLLRDLDLPPDALELELTESMLLSNKDNAAKQIARLRHSGIRVALDDFGTGYSALSYLTELRFDILKLDRSFVAKLPQEKEPVAIIKAVVELAHSLNMQVVAEGIETDAQLNCLRALDCDEGQGYHFARPLTAGELEHWLGHWLG
ncbi:EAL domain-containing protein [Gallaecimonas pentaromativorans]|uniref:PAS domain S-box-containing protein/diguanylate cyclase (GGDEF)-like protein n=1 Tax=Gallaecimonas pentaromativorans TaxID=584787 RepID=A0A3N1NW48_9GAMM|nr:EAL domain-containing protein [Gallaecimonas pentaromativorans]ROQ19187.1 PAS domain S-box-containing protein/diguanylate cyclase (GGDEF)-like protein [Gallaecimonas pentaromativorans]